MSLDIDDLGFDDPPDPPVSESLLAVLDSLEIEYGPISLPDLERVQARHDLEIARLTQALSRTRDAMASQPTRVEMFRGVLWSRDPVTRPDGQTAHRVAIVGVLVSDRPFAGLNTEDEGWSCAGETVICGRVPGLANVIAAAEHGHATVRLPDANGVLTGLDCYVDVGPAPELEEWQRPD